MTIMLPSPRVLIAWNKKVQEESRFKSSQVQDESRFKSSQVDLVNGDSIGRRDARMLRCGVFHWTSCAFLITHVAALLDNVQFNSKTDLMDKDAHFFYFTPLPFGHNYGFPRVEIDSSQYFSQLLVPEHAKYLVLLSYLRVTQVGKQKILFRVKHFVRLIIWYLWELQTFRHGHNFHQNFQFTIWSGHLVMSVEMSRDHRNFWNHSPKRACEHRCKRTVHFVLLGTFISDVSCWNPLLNELSQLITNPVEQIESTCRQL